MEDKITQPIDVHGGDLVRSMLLAHLFDSASLFHHRNFPRDVLRQTLQHFIPSVDGYLIPRPLARSYYQICEDECTDYLFDYIDDRVFPMSISYYDRIPQSNPHSSISSTEARKVHIKRTNLTATAPRVLRFLQRVRSELDIKTAKA
jgi:hypothetical protein